MIDHHQNTTKNKGMIKPFLFISCIISNAIAHSLTLSPIENFLFNSRLNNIQSSIKSKFESTLPTSTKEHIILIFPGAGGVDDRTLELQKYLSLREDAFVSIVDWKEHRGSILSAAFDSEAVGEAVANVLYHHLPSEVKTIHGIGISVGSFAANTFADTTKQLLQDRDNYVRLTLLDPFCSRGIWGVGYGLQHFGCGVDYAEHYLNTDDPVPSTNEPMDRGCAVIDVTGAKERNGFVPPKVETMHCWPVVYYARYGCQNSRLFERVYHGQESMPARGSIQAL